MVARTNKKYSKQKRTRGRYSRHKYSRHKYSKRKHSKRKHSKRKHSKKRSISRVQKGGELTFPERQTESDEPIPPLMGYSYVSGTVKKGAWGGREGATGGFLSRSKARITDTLYTRERNIRIYNDPRIGHYPILCWTSDDPNSPDAKWKFMQVSYVRKASSSRNKNELRIGGVLVDNTTTVIDGVMETREGTRGQWGEALTMGRDHLVRAAGSYNVDVVRWGDETMRTALQQLSERGEGGGGSAAAAPIPPAGTPVEPTHTVNITVPSGVGAGQQLNVRMDDGREIRVIVPEGVSEGSTLQVQVPGQAAPTPPVEHPAPVPDAAAAVVAAAGDGPPGDRPPEDDAAPADDGAGAGPPPAATGGYMNITVPVGAAAGQELNVRMGDGREIRVIVPEGVSEGSTLQVQVPGQAAPTPPVEHPAPVPDAAAAVVAAAGDGPPGDRPPEDDAAPADDGAGAGPPPDAVPPAVPATPPPPPPADDGAADDGAAVPPAAVPPVVAADGDGPPPDAVPPAVPATPPPPVPAAAAGGGDDGDVVAL